MNKEQQNRSIAEYVGWKYIRPIGGAYYAYWRCGSEMRDELPDYLNDLNAMHEAEKLLTVEQYPIFDETLYDVVGTNEKNIWSYIRAASATASQRAEAFLKTIGKWET